LSRVYSPYLGRYVPYSGPLTVYTFRVTEAGTGIPVANAQCAIQDVPLGFRTLEGAGGYTDLNGVCSIDVLFAARYYGVYKAGYVTARGSVPGTQINVSLTPTAVKYWVTINAGVGGSVNPSGNYQVAANTKLTATATPETGYVLDYWLVNNVKSGNTNPLGVTIDRDHYSIYAIFKKSITPPPSNGGQEWPVERNLTIFNGEILQANQWQTGISKVSSEIGIGDSKKYLGARLEYSITYLEGNAGLITVGIDVNNVNQISKGLKLTDKYGPPVPTTSGTKDITTPLYLTGNKVKIGHAQPIGAWSKAAYLVKLVIGYSGEPAIEPGEEPGPWDWLPKLEWWQWGIIGGVGVLGTWTVLSSKGYAPSPTIIITQPYEYAKERLGEYAKERLEERKR